MSNQDAPKTLFEIIDSALLQFEDSNLKSDEARRRIADEICDKYYTSIDPNLFDEDDFNTLSSGIKTSNDDILQQGE